MAKDVKKKNTSKKAAKVQKEETKVTVEKVEVTNKKDKIEWTVIFLTEFGKRHGLTLKQAFNYLLRYKGINFVEQHYDYLHTQSFVSAVDDLTQYCNKLGGGIA